MATKKRKKTAPKKAKKKPALDIDAELSVERLLERGRKLDEEREARAAEEANKPKPVRAPVASRPAAPFQWGYNWWFDASIPAARREELTAFFSRFTKVDESRGGFVVAAPDTPPERRRAPWDAGGTVVELDQLDAQLPAKDDAARLERVLSTPSSDAWWEAIMLLSTWSPDSLPAAIAATERALEKWPDETRFLPDPWKERPELRALTRVVWGEIKTALAERPDLENVSVVKTQDADGLRENAARFGHVKRLDVSGVVGLGDLVAGLADLRNLEHLELQQPTYGSGTGTLDLGKLLRAPHLQSLKALSLYGYTLTPDDLETLAACDQPLEWVRIQYAGMKPAMAKSLAKLASRKRIRRLDLKYNDLGPKGAQALFANGADWGSLEVLDFSANEIGDRGAAAIAGADMRSLRFMILSSNDAKEQLGEAGAMALANSKTLAGLHTLNVYGHPIGPKGVAALASMPRMGALCTAFPGCAIAEIVDAASGAPSTVEELHLGNSDAPKTKKKIDWSNARLFANVRTLNADSLPGGEYAALLGCPHMGALEILALGGCYTDPEKGFEALVSAKPPPNLRYVDLNGQKWTPDQAKRFAASPLGKQLWGVSMMSMYVTPEAWQIFYEAGLPIVGSSVFFCDPASEHRSLTTFREEIPRVSDSL